MSLDEAVLAFGAFVSCLVAAGFLLAFYAPAYREEARKEELRRGRIRRTPVARMIYRHFLPQP